ncbi:hypothetical protein T02_6992 [Trichinella nativa]|uniref:Uncharacterized protein n=1 Tax=Trichinella nativa TaxID=6335 RepID=A0A0V1LL70_9BILA|nr:hypothetical protein T02_6992 [Trichinella nativa]
MENELPKFCSFVKIASLSLHVFTVPKVETSLDKSCDSTGLSCFVSRSEAKMSRITGIHAFANTLNTVYRVVPDNKSLNCKNVRREIS